MIDKDNNQEILTNNQKAISTHNRNNDNEYSKLKISEDISPEIKKNVEDLNEQELNFKYYLINLTPNLVANTSISLVSLMERHFAGKESTDLVTGIGLGSIFSSFICASMGCSIADSICVIASKYFGNKNYYYVGQTRNLISIFILILILLYSIFAFLFPESVLKNLTKQSDPIIKIGAGYIKTTFFKIFLDLLYYIMKNYFESQLIYLPTWVSTITGIFLYPIFAYLFIIRLKMGYIGAALAFTVDSLIKLEILLIYNFVFNPYPESNVGFDKHTFDWDHVSTTVKIAFHNVISLISETYGWAIVLIFAARLESTQYSLFVLLESIVLFNTALGIGWMVTNVVLIGNYVGEMKPDLVRKTIKYTFLSFIFIYIPLIIGFLLFKNQILNFFTNDPKIIDFPQKTLVLILVAILLILDCLINIYGGILRGLGEEKFTSILNSISMFILVPCLAYILAFVADMQIIGIFLAYDIIYIIILLIDFIYFKFFVDVNLICENYVEDNLKSKSLEKED